MSWSYAASTFCRERYGDASEYSAATAATPITTGHNQPRRAVTGVPGAAANAPTTRNSGPWTAT
jgi:hypothetical protein